MTKRLLVMAGGTGGHVFPGLAVAEYLQASGWHVEWLGTADRMEAQLVPKHGFKINFVNIAGVRGNGILRLIKAPFMIVNAVVQSIRLLRRFKPHLVLGMGGYASGPGGAAAWLCGIPLILHEQNATPGMTNKILAGLARRVLTAFDIPGWPKSGANKLQVGNPVREVFASVSEKTQIEGELKILVCGGSLGAQVLNECVPLALAEQDNTSFEVWHQAGKGNSDKVVNGYSTAGFEASRVRVNDFIDEMVDAYEWADLVICRAGALTVSEVALAGRCAIFVPLPHAVDDHQTKNAQYLVANDAALLLPQPLLETGGLAALIADLNTKREKIISMSEKARACGAPKATEKVANICIQEASAKP